MPDIVIAGATFRSVPQIDIPKEGSGTASFVYEDGTKQITENGSNIDVSGYAAVDVAVPGSQPVIQPLSVTQNGTYTAPSGVDGYSPVTVNVSGGGGGGLEYETGEWSPEEDTNVAQVYFQRTHNIPPICVAIADKKTDTATANSGLANMYFDYYRLLGYGYSRSTSSSTTKTRIVRYNDSVGTGSSIAQVYSTSATYDSDNPDSSSSSYSRYYVNTDKFRVDTGNSGRFWHKDHIYKWLAIWAPTT